MDLQWNPNYDMFIFVCGGTLVNLGANWAFGRTKPVVLNAGKTAPAYNVTAEHISAVEIAPSGIPVVSSPGRSFYTIEVKSDVSYGSSIGDFELSPVQDNPGKGAVTKAFYASEMDSSMSCLDMLGDLELSSLSFPRAPKAIRANDVHAFEVDNNTCVADRISDFAFRTIADAPPLESSVPGPGGVFERLQLFFFTTFTTLYLLCINMLREVPFWIEYEAGSYWAKQRGPAFIDFLLDIINVVFLFLRRQLRNVVVSLLKDDFVSMAEHIRVQKAQGQLNSSLSLSVTESRDFLDGFLQTLDDVSAKLQKVQQDAALLPAVHSDVLQALEAMKKDIHNMQERTAFSPNPPCPHAAEVAILLSEREDVCKAIRKYSTRNVNFKSAFEEQVSRIPDDNLPGHVAALLGYIQSEFGHIATSSSRPAAFPPAGGYPSGYGGYGRR